MTAQVKLYDSTTIDTLPWPDSEIATLAKNYWLPLMKGGATQFIDNVNSQLFALAIDELVFPVTVNEREWQNSYVCSPYSHYITYTKEELYTLNNPLLEQVLKILLNGMGVILQLGQINQVVIVNNWLLSTNLYPNLSKSQIATLTTYLQEQFPKHTIIFRSINTYLDDCLFAAFQDNGYH
ncbi:MAG: hypothetical protein LRZ84_17190 [Desertifilum sp.]|nr:hypothetical protein [Desertifilum sp.]